MGFNFKFKIKNSKFKNENSKFKIQSKDFHFLGDVETCTRAMSRVMIIDRIDKNELQGYLVFNDKKAIGWCNVNNRYNYQRLLRDYDLIDNPDDKVCSIVCFLIHPSYRRQGVSQKIIERVIDDCLNSDYDYIESYPKKGESGSSNFKGPLELFKMNNFEMFKEHEAYYVMRKYLK